MTETLWIVLVVLGVACGAGIGFFVGGRSPSRQAQLDQLAAELDDERKKAASAQSAVTEHFERSAHLFGRLAGDYQAFFEHFVESADRLGLPESQVADILGDAQLRLIEGGDGPPDADLAETAEVIPAAEAPGSPDAGTETAKSPDSYLPTADDGSSEPREESVEHGDQGGGDQNPAESRHPG